MSTAEKLRMTREDYLAFERASEEKHEFADGEMFAMAGARRRHNMIAINIGREASEGLRRRPCEVYSSDMRVKIPNTDRYVYPDVSIACGEPRFEDDEDDTLENPTVVFEVLSNSTEGYDRGEKFALYETIPSLAEIVLVATNRVRVDHFLRQADGSWVLRSFGPGERMPLPSCEAELTIDEVYLKAFDRPSAPIAGS